MLGLISIEGYHIVFLNCLEKAKDRRNDRSLTIKIQHSFLNYSIVVHALVIISNLESYSTKQI